jgi:hypothetical protein
MTFEVAVTPNVLVEMAVSLCEKLLVRKVQPASSHYMSVLLWSNREVDTRCVAVSTCAPASFFWKPDPAALIESVNTAPIPHRLPTNREALIS